MTEVVEELPRKRKCMRNVKLQTEIDEIIDKIDRNDENLTPVIEECFYEPVSTVKCYVATIRSLKEISTIVKVLSQKLPLPKLKHLKRVKKQKVLLALVESLDDNTIEEIINNEVPELREFIEDFVVEEVPAKAPRVKKQFLVANAIWPTNFHPDKFYERLVSGHFFEAADLKLHKLFMRTALEAAKFYADKNNVKFEDINISVIVDPKIQSIVAISSNNTEHPIKHAAMMAIDKVAATQNGGAWSSNSRDVTLRGIDEDLERHIINRIPNLKFGARKYVSKRDEAEDSIAFSDVPYLCTGYFIYTIREPCLMCSMALVHSRINKIFFCCDNLKNGALKSTVKVHTIKDLNHHFEVYTGFL